MVLQEHHQNRATDSTTLHLNYSAAHSIVLESSSLHTSPQVISLQGKATTEKRRLLLFSQMHGMGQQRHSTDQSGLGFGILVGFLFWFWFWWN
jgi:hypothetical protein